MSVFGRSVVNSGMIARMGALHQPVRADSQSQPADDSGFAEIYQRYAQSVYRFCFAEVRDRAVAEDISAQVLTDAWFAYRRARPDDAGVRPWLFRIARNALIDHHRRSLRGARAFRLLGLGHRASEPDPSVLAELRDQLRAALMAIAALPERDRLLIALRVAAGLSFAEIAAVVGISEEAAQVATRRALARVRGEVEGR